MIGPELPPHLQRHKKDEEEEASDDEDAFLPELPPDLKAGTKPASSTPGPSPSPSRSSAAPASTSKPSAPTRPPPAPAPYDDDDSDDDVGPKPLGAPAVRHDENEGIRRFLEVEQRRREEAEVSVTHACYIVLRARFSSSTTRTADHLPHRTPPNPRPSSANPGCSSRPPHPSFSPVRVHPRSLHAPSPLPRSLPSPSPFLPTQHHPL